MKEDEKKDESNYFIIDDDLNANDPPFWEKRFGLNRMTFGLRSKVDFSPKTIK